MTTSSVPGFFTVLAVAVCAGPMVLGSADRIPPPQPGSTAIACHAGEPGERLLIAGRVVGPGNVPISGATVIAYNTDATGLYNPQGSPTHEPRIRATVSTDADGRFQVLTVFPGGYPDATDPAHVHFHVLAAGYTVKYSTIWFKGDPRITPALTEAANARRQSHPNDETVILDAPGKDRGVKAVEHTIALTRS